jgi:hypothetical protein
MSIALWERRGELSPGIARLCGCFDRDGVSLRTSRATRRIHTLGPPVPHFRPKLSAVSLSRAVRVMGGSKRSIGRNLLGLASES